MTDARDQRDRGLLDRSDEEPDCPVERETLRMHARSIAATATVIAVLATVVIAGAVAWLMQPLRWPTTIGSVESSFWATNLPDEAQGASIVYVYEVDGTTHRGTRLSLMRFGGRADAGSGQWPWHERELVEQHPPGAPIEVRYDPRNPSNAVVVCRWNMPGFWAAGAVLAVVWGIALECRRRSRGPLVPRDLDTMGWRWAHPD